MTMRLLLAATLAAGLAFAPAAFAEDGDEACDREEQDAQAGQSA